jgi:PAS domain S-box-containing protein
MITVDLRTIFFNYILTNIVSLIVMIILWQQSRKRFEGTFYLIIDFLFQVLCVLLIFLRGHIPDFVSIDIANLFAVSGAVLGYIGLEYFTGKKSNQIHNYLLIAAFFAIHIYFTFVQPDLAIRNLNSALAYLIISLQCAWLLLKRVPANLRRFTFNVGMVFVLFSVVNIFRIIEFFITNHSSTDYFKAGSFETFVIISYQLLFILLTFSLALMINKRLLKEIATQEEKFSKAFHSVPYAIIITKLSDGRLFEVNDGFEKITNFSASEVIGKTTLELNFWVSDEDRELLVNTLIEKGKVNEMESEFHKKTGEIFIGLLTAEIITINNEICILSVIHDVTKRKQAEVALHESEIQLRELNATKDKFLSIIAHDLKSPFNSILGLSELLVEQIMKKDYTGIEEYAAIIQNSSQRVMDLLSNLLEWSRSQTGRIEYNPEYTEMVKLINDVIELSSDTIRQKSISISKELPQKAIAFADRAMISTVLRNLLSNAIKFTKPGGKISISASIKPDEFLISVSDNGIGINKDHLEKLFRIGESESTMGTQNEKGTGLGLILCKEFIEKHGGKIWAESDPNPNILRDSGGKGSTFYFTIPKI